MRAKRGEEKIFSIWWFVAVIVIVGVIILSVSIFYSADYDSRLVEAEILNNHLAECLINLGHLDGEFFSENFEEKIYSFCNLEESLFQEGSDYYFKINSSVKMGWAVSGGGDFGSDCNIYLSKGGRGIEYFPRCVLRKEKVYFGGKEHILEILTGSNNRGTKGEIV